MLLESREAARGGRFEHEERGGSWRMAEWRWCCLLLDGFAFTEHAFSKGLAVIYIELLPCFYMK